MSASFFKPEQLPVGFTPGFVPGFPAQVLTPPSTGQALWLRADLGVTVSGGFVTSWADQSGNGNNFAQATSGKQATVNASSVNGKTGLTFGGGAGMSGPAITITGARTQVVVFKLASTPAADSGATLLSIKNSTPTFAELVLFNIGGYLPYSWCYDYTDALTVGINTALDTSAHVLIVEYNGSDITAPSSYVADKDGSTATLAASGESARTSSDLCSIGSRLTSGNALVNAMNGDLCEAMVYDHSLTAPELVQLKAYLLGRYGIA